MNHALSASNKKPESALERIALSTKQIPKHDLRPWLETVRGTLVDALESHPVATLFAAFQAGASLSQLRKKHLSQSIAGLVMGLMTAGGLKQSQKKESSNACFNAIPKD